MSGSDAARQVLARAEVELARSDRLLEVAHVAHRLNRCAEQIRRYIRRGQLYAVRGPGSGNRPGNYLIPESAVRDFLRHLTT